MTRISVLPGDADRVENPKLYSVTLDGVKQSHCLVADSKKGHILRYKLNALGIPQRNRQGKFITETVEGVVTIIKDR